uniref:Migration and invasion inhibitory protein n=1 Tax=Cyanoderma ruficeps TaxID=181631 RepID=A0A8C3NVW8_9PASS
MDFQRLERLRQASQDLLQRLRMNQEEIRKELPSKQLLPASLPSSTAADRCVPLPRRVKASPKHSITDRGVQQQVKIQEGAGKEENVTPASAVIACGRRISRVDENGHAQGSPEKESSFPSHGENRRQFALQQGLHEKSHPGPSLSGVQDKGVGEQRVVFREPPVLKSVLVTSRSKRLKKKGRRVTFKPDPEEYAIPVSSWSARPLLGYDWISGLLDTKSPVTEKSEQYFAELQEFRQSNRETCIDQEHLEPKALDCKGPEQELDLITGSHKCVYCYRLNQRLFPIPVDSESACPVCKIPRSHQPPGTLEEPTCVRVSISRRTLLPAHKYRAHRRRSFEATDDLALPSHCLAGWENMVPSSSTPLSSLDLRASLKEKPSPSSSPGLGVQSGRRSQK